MKQLLLDVLQTAINRYLALDPESIQRLKKLEGKLIAIDLLGLGFNFFLFFQNNKIIVKQQESLPPDTHIKGTPLSLLRLTLTQNDRKQFFADDVSIEGNLDLGQDVIDLFDQLEIDWEEIISRYIGDVGAHQVGNILRSVGDFYQRSKKNWLQNLNEYVHEEKNWFPPPELIHDFFLEVDALRMDLDRLLARVDRLRKNRNTQ